jgi:uncharacterized repeat protein (TIGR02543 family)
VIYTLPHFGKNGIKLYAKDKSSAGNKGSQTITLDYNTEPTAITLTAPTANAIGVSTSPTFKWSGADDADGDGVTFIVNYGTSQTSLSNTATVTDKTATPGSPLVYAKTYYWQLTATSSSTAYPDKVQSGVGTFSTEGSLPLIAVHPQSKSVEEGQNATFNITASGFGTLSYQWRLNGTNIPGATSTSYTVTLVTISMNNNTYDCVVKNEVGEVTSNAAKLTVSSIPYFTVSFDMHGGTAIQSQTVIRDGLAQEPPTPQRTNYAFKGWFTSSAFTTSFNFSTPITADQILHAKWVDVYTMTYYPNTADGGSVPTDNKKYVSGETVTVAGNTGNLYKNNYTFAGWTTNAQGIGTVYNTPNTLAMGSAAMSLYAKWEIKTFTVTFKDGTWSEVKTVNSGSSIQNCPRLDDKPDKTFDGWSDPDICTRSVTNNLTVTAVWKDIPTYTVTFHSDDSEFPNESIVVHEGDLVPNHSKIGYNECWYYCGYDRGDYGNTTLFCGWYNNPTAGNLVSPNQKVYGNMDLYTHSKYIKILDHPAWGVDCSDYHHHTPADLE